MKRGWSAPVCALVVAAISGDLICAALANRQRGELELRRARLEPWPEVTLGLAGGHDAADKDTLMEFRVSLPLPVFDRAQGRQREACALAPQRPRACAGKKLLGS
jgi:outer membrane protein TolC